MASPKQDDELSLISDERADVKKGNTRYRVQEPASKSKRYLVVLCILFVELCERLTFYGLTVNLVFYVRVARTISALTREILFLPREHKIHIFEPTCNVLFIIWRLNKRDAKNQFDKGKKRES